MREKVPQISLCKPYAVTGSHFTLSHVNHAQRSSYSICSCQTADPEVIVATLLSISTSISPESVFDTIELSRFAGTTAVKVSNVWISEDAALIELSKFVAVTEIYPG